MNMFRDTYALLKDDLLQIAKTVQSVPEDARPGTAHIDHLSAIMQYAYYVALVRQWLHNPNAKILDWGGQHGQVTKLLNSIRTQPAMR